MAASARKIAAQRRRRRPWYGSSTADARPSTWESDSRNRANMLEIRHVRYLRYTYMYIHYIYTYAFVRLKGIERLRERGSVVCFAVWATRGPFLYMTRCRSKTYTHTRIHAGILPICIHMCSSTACTNTWAPSGHTDGDTLSTALASSCRIYRAADLDCSCSCCCWFDA